MEPTSELLLDVRHLSKTFPLKKSKTNKAPSFKAVDDVSFQVFKGETLGIVGESGSGKSTVAKMILQLLEPTNGEIYFLGQNLANQSKAESKATKRRMQAVFQDPYASLNPRMRAKEIVTEPLILHKQLNKKNRDDKALELLHEVGLSEQHLNRFPHEFSGGQRQRLSIARAIALKPDLIICDEAVSALDVSIQAQILKLLKSLQTSYGLSYIFIAHGLPTVKQLSNRVAIMHKGKIVEIGETNDIFQSPTHTYTKSLLKAVPPSHPRDRHKPSIGG
ncbi:ATP-binding cassette domain-containing protein [Shouchella clausii]|uniref:ABC transporter ATP-binding protein n=1 Tax=Shouchella clausii TaxID=79880 RepID=A0A268S4Z2_SHOCL|nr:ATP-binding cassette domain-containing protein [Shouchella clausii]PAD43674.1 ABC transporter ATP-binding protein [Bacillus sp. 7520-S]AST98165.1 ABC transporter ATP-binding protein [Shouchella clausii]MCR1286964.1 ATP-binding cassette domain-containing protein [Shouchella clausii]MEB5472845.1 ATP-binding cassette domain-containing protein [Shouchella clausii]PAE97131.1 ABC transporter ATP-binding protein [Shouchella clausii]